MEERGRRRTEMCRPQEADDAGIHGVDLGSEVPRGAVGDDVSRGRIALDRPDLGRVNEEASRVVERPIARLQTEAAQPQPERLALEDVEQAPPQLVGHC
jgi:hypothetical protein